MEIVSAGSPLLIQSKKTAFFARQKGDVRVKSIKQSLTWLIKAINSKLPDGEDIFGYAGVNKAAISDCLNESYNLLSRLEEKKESFEVILLKRQLSEYIGSCNNFLNEELGTSSEERSFNDFLNTIASIKYHIKQTYLLVVENSIRNEAVIVEHRRELEELEGLLEKYKQAKEDVEGYLTTSKELSESIEVLNSSAEEERADIAKSLGVVNNNSAVIQETRNNTDRWSVEIEGYKSDISERRAEFAEYSSRFSSLLENVEEIQSRLNSQQEKLAVQSITSNKQQDDIREIIEDANRASMAGSFKKRKDELGKPIRTSEFVMHGALVVMAVVSYFLLKDSGLGTNDFDYAGFLGKLPIIAPIIWMAWSSAKKLGHLTRIREDYAYKYASAMAFEGYRKQAENVDPDLLKRLLETAIDHMGNNPIRLFDSKSNHASPLHEITHAAKDAVAPVLNGSSKDSP